MEDSREKKGEMGVRRRGSAPYRIRLLTEDSLDDQDPWFREGPALAVDLAACGLVFTRGTPPRTEGCRTVGRGRMTVTHDLKKNVREPITGPQLVSGSRDTLPASGSPDEVMPARAPGPAHAEQHQVGDEDH